MEFLSILNDVLGPVMRGPSSSHTAGAYRIAAIARSLLAEAPARVEVRFDPDGSYAATYAPLGVDIAFAAGLIGWPMTDERYPEARVQARKRGIDLEFVISPLEDARHPNATVIDMTSHTGTHLSLSAESIGGGVVRITRLAGWPVLVMGKSHEVLVEMEEAAEPALVETLERDGHLSGPLVRQSDGERVLLHGQRVAALEAEQQSRIQRLAGVRRLWKAPPVFYVKRGEALFSSAGEMVSEAERRRASLGRIALAYESEILGMSEQEVMDDVLHRLDIMIRSVHDGLQDHTVNMLLLHPTAHGVLRAEAEGRVAIGGIHTRAAARAMAVMHTCNSRGVVCAAPTGGSAGVVPGVVVTLLEEKGLSTQRGGLALLAASAIGLIVARRATFAAEEAGCQVEIGAAGAMAAAAVVEVAGGTAREAAAAAAIALQNTMGSVCDPVHGACEIPCHTRNAVASAAAFVCADLILGGYHNPIPLDETIDASYAVGRALAPELRCTAKGGIAVAPSALSLPRLR